MEKNSSKKFHLLFLFPPFFNGSGNSGVNRRRLGVEVELPRVKISETYDFNATFNYERISLKEKVTVDFAITNIKYPTERVTPPTISSSMGI